MYTGAPAEIFPRGGAKALPKHSYILHISVCVGLLYKYYSTLLCIVCIGSRNFRSPYICMQIEKKPNTMKEDNYTYMYYTHSVLYFSIDSINFNKLFVE